MNYIYRKPNDQNIYQAGTNKVLTPAEFGNGSGYQELKAIDGAKYNTKALQEASFSNINEIGNSLYGLEKAPAVNQVSQVNPVVQNQGNILDAKTITTGIQTGGTPPISLSSNEQSQNAYLDGALKANANNSAEIQQNLLKAQQLKEAEQNRIQAENQYQATQDKRQAEVTNFDTQNNPITEAVRTSRTNALTALNDVYTSDKFKSDLLEQEKIVNEIKDLTDLAQKSISQANLGGATLSSIRQGRITDINETYKSSMDLKNGYLKALQGKLDVAQKYLDFGADTLTQGYNDRINFLNSINSFYSTQLSNEKGNVDALKSNEKELINQAIKDLEDKKTTLEATKSAIEKVMSENPVVANGAKLALTDTPEQIATKLNKFYTDKPQYLPDNQAWIKKAMDKYFDVGITLNDPIETVKSKILLSKIYEKDTSVKSTETKNGSGSNNTDVSKGIVGGFNISSYATDPNHENAVASILQGIGKFNTIQDIDNYIKSKYPNSPITGQIIANTSSKFRVPWEMLVSMMEQDSSLGTAGKGARTFNPGNVGNDDSGNLVNYGNWQSGVDAVGNWLNKHRVENTSNIDTPENNSNKTISEQLEASDPEAYDWAINIQSGKSKMSEITGNPGLKSRVNSMIAKLPPPKSEIDKAEKMISSLETLKNHPGLNSAVGTGILGLNRVPLWDLGGNKNAFLGKANEFVSQNALNKLIEAKKEGATFGALSDRELSVLSSASTALGTWEILNDNGKVKGYDISESEFKKEIDSFINDYKQLVDDANKANGLPPKYNISSSSGKTPNGMNWSVKAGGQTTPSGVSYEIIQ